MNSTQRPAVNKASSLANDNAKAYRPCPICRRPSVEKHKPFCSRRCADVDLYRWLNGNYVIPAGEASEPSGDVGDEDK